jgi:hypothetical protein
MRVPCRTCPKTRSTQKAECFLAVVQGLLDRTPCSSGKLPTRRPTSPLHKPMFRKAQSQILQVREGRKDPITHWTIRHGFMVPARGSKPKALNAYREPALVASANTGRESARSS